MKNLIPLAYLTVFVGLVTSTVSATEILWSQYLQHQGTMKLLVHLDTDPTEAYNGEVVTLWLREGKSDEWTETQTQPVHSLTATALFELESWPRHEERLFKVTTGESEWEGTFKAEPKEGSVLKVAGFSCHKDIGWPWTEAIGEVIDHDPDLVIFTGDQIYENDYGSPMFRAMTEEEVPKGMKNYLEKYRKFGEAFGELMRDRPTIMITDDHDQSVLSLVVTFQDVHQHPKTFVKAVDTAVVVGDVPP